MESKNAFDIIIVGGSYSGLSAALALARSLRKVLIIDSQEPCNKPTPHSHNFLTRDGETPAQLAAIATENVLRYPTAMLVHGKAVVAKKEVTHFTVQLENGTTYSATKLLLATGITNNLPSIPGLADCWGISVLHCPYCHGYEVAGQQWGILANGADALHFAMLLSNWTQQLVIFTNEPCQLERDQVQKIKDKGIIIMETPLLEIVHKDGYLQSVQLKDGSRYPLSVLFVRAPFQQHTDLPEQLGCTFTETGYIQTDGMQRTTVPGVYAAGDNCNQLRTVSVAVASGTAAGSIINMDLITEQF